MEVKLKAGDSLNIPEGCKAVIKDNVVVFEKEEKEELREFKDGDVLHSICDHEVLIFKKNTDSEYFSSHYNYSGKDNNMWLIDAFRHATEEEKQTLFDKMKEEGLQWNADENRVEKIRWRANMNEYYYFVTPIGTICKSVVKNGLVLTSLERYEFFNQFRTEEQAIEAAKLVKDTLRKYHEEIGE